EELEYIQNSNERVVSFFDHEIKEALFEGNNWANITDRIIDKLPEHVYVSFDIDGLDPKLCPHTGTPVHGGFEVDQIFYLFKKLIASGRKLIGFDLVEVGVSHDEWDE